MTADEDLTDAPNTADGGTRDGAARGRVEVTYDGTTQLSVAIVRAVSEATATPIDDIDVELNAIVDPDALTNLFADRLDGRPRRGGRVSFSMLGCHVEVDSDGRIVVVPEDAPGRDA